MTYPRTVSARLLGSDASTVIGGVLDNSYARTYMKELSGYGTGSLRIPYGEDVSQVTRGRFIQILIAGTARFAFMIEDGPEYTQVAKGEEVEQFWSVQGRGWGCCSEDGLIYPEGDLSLSRILPYAYRRWSFASINFPNAGSWGPAIEDYEYKEGVTQGWRVDQVVEPGDDPDDPGDDVVKDFAAPQGFPWANASKNGNGFAPTPSYVGTYWVRADGSSDPEDEGTHYFRGSIGLAGVQETMYQVTADNYYVLFVDGVPIIENIEDSLGWLDYKDDTLPMPAGTHIIAAAVENPEAAVTFNPGGLLLAVIAMSVYPGDIATTQTLALLTSSAADLVSLFVPTGGNHPGWRPEQILIDIIDEAVLRSEIPNIQVSFTDSLDSNGNTPDSIDPDTTIEFIPNFSMRIGQNLGDALKQMFDEGWIDWTFDFDTMTLNVYNQGSVGSTSGVTYTSPGTITGLERGPTEKYANALLIQYDGGCTEYVDTAAVAANDGIRVPDFFTCDAETEEEALRQGRVNVARRVAGAQAAVLLTVEPSSTADCPEEGVLLGDYIEIPNIDNDATDNVQVLSITMEEDDQQEGIGHAQWRLECNARWRAPQADIMGVIRRISGKPFKIGPGGAVARD